MKLTKNQVELLMDLSGQIKEQYNILIGYATPTFPIPMMQEVDFIVWESNEDDAQCFHKDDIETRPMGPTMVRILPENPEHDDKVEALFDKIDEDILSGRIWFDPSGEKTVDGLTVSVTKKRFPNTSEDIYVTNLRDADGNGPVFTYDFINEAAHSDPKFRLAKEIIDDLWPRLDKKDLTPPVIQAPPKLTLFQRVFKFFMDLFGL